MQSNDFIRVALLAERKGWLFPRFSEDDVIQHCIEEAGVARIDAIRARAEEHAANESAVRAAQERVRLEMEQGA